MQIPKPGNDRVCFHNVVNINQILRRCTAIAQVLQEQQMTRSAFCPRVGAGQMFASALLLSSGSS